MYHINDMIPGTCVITHCHRSSVCLIFKQEPKETGQSMRQAFVPATGLAGEGTASKKRRRAVAAGDGQAVSSIYEGIVQPGIR